MFLRSGTFVFFYLVEILSSRKSKHQRANRLSVSLVNKGHDGREGFLENTLFLLVSNIFFAVGLSWPLVMLVSVGRSTGHYPTIVPGIQTSDLPIMTMRSSNLLDTHHLCI